MAAIGVQVITRSGVTPSLGAVVEEGDSFANDGNTFVEILNSSGANAYTVTFDANGSYKGVALQDVEVSIPANGNKLVGPFPIEAFGSTVGVTYSGSAPETDLTIGAFKGV
jgi:hypothetical protein